MLTLVVQIVTALFTDWSTSLNCQIYHCWWHDRQTDRHDWRKLLPGHNHCPTNIWAEVTQKRLSCYTSKPYHTKAGLPMGGREEG